MSERTLAALIAALSECTHGGAYIDVDDPTFATLDGTFDLTKIAAAIEAAMQPLTAPTD